MFITFRKTLMVSIDLLIVNLALLLAFMIRFDWKLAPDVGSVLMSLVLWVSFIRLIIFYFEGLYQWSFRYASLGEAIRIVRAVAFGTLSLIAIAYFKRYYPYIGRSVFLIDFLICLFFIMTYRFFFRIINKIKSKHPINLKRVLIVGAGDAGEMVVRELLNAKKKEYIPIGFIDDDSRKKNLKIHGIRVLGNKEEIAKIAKDYRIEEIIISVPSVQGKVIRDIISNCQKANLKIKIIPGLLKILSGEVSIKEIRDVNPEDLLGRKTVQINSEEAYSFLQNKVILVTGAGGSIGSELCRQIVKFNAKMLLLYDHNENDVYFLEIECKKKFPHIQIVTIIGDIKDIGHLKYTFSKYKPEIVFHAAAHKHVPLLEYNAVSAVKNDVIGTRNLIYAASHYKIDRFVMISTDKAVNPTSIMGASKRIAEMLLQAKAKINGQTKFMAVRFGNVIGSNGSVVQLFKKQIEERGPLTVTHPEIKRYFMSVGEAAQLVIQAGAFGKGGEIFVLDMGEPIKILDLAKDLIILSGFDLDRDISIEFIGLRPGDKLYEEPLHDIEYDMATKHDKIFITQPNDFDIIKLRNDIKDLENLSNIMAEEKLIEKIKEIVPFHSTDKPNPSANHL